MTKSLDELSPKEFIIIKRARVNNLKNLSVAIPEKQTRGDYGLVGFGKVFACLRYPFRRRPADVR